VQQAARVQAQYAGEAEYTPDFCLRRGWDEITKARLSRVFPGEVDRAKCRKTQLDAPKVYQTRHRAGLSRTPKHSCWRCGA